MKLVTVEVKNYRRFEEPARLETYGPVVCIVGPNEAGKSSLLDAMMALNDTGSLVEQDSTRDSGNVAKVSASYLLEDDDRAAISHIPGGDDVRWWTVSREPNGQLTFVLVPNVSIDLSTRQKVRATLAHYVDDKALKRLGKAGKVDPPKMIDQALGVLENNVEQLSDRQTKAVRDLGVFLTNQADNVSPPSKDDEYKAFLRQLSEYREGPSTRQQACNELNGRRPLFVKFDDPDRDLKSSYDLARYANEPPLALRNVARLGELDLPELLASMQSGPATKRSTLVDNAKQKLLTSLEGTWRQAKIGIGLDTENTTLEVSIFDRELGEFTELSSRSAGLKWFVAFRAFMETVNEPDRDPPILLVDEAESHLHYDAQADLVQLFYDQPVANKVIYTTHSAGCLPQDLGASIRVVRPVADAKSVVQHNPWIEQESLGITPLVHGMGATTLAFMPSRRAVMVEGSTDAMLYPTLFREVAGKDNLEFQVVPGVSFAARAKQIGLKTEAESLVFVLDNDQAGLDYRDELTMCGISPESIFIVGEGAVGIVELEDLIDPGQFAEAVSSIVNDFGKPELEFQSTDIPGFERMAAVSKWCKEHGMNVGKRNIALRLVEMKSRAHQNGEECRLIWSEREDLLAHVYEQINHVMGIGKKEE
jgi:predicted ATP-dependent endonuclease of OLD family